MEKIRFIPINNAVDEIYAKMGIPFPAGITEGSSEASSPFWIKNNSNETMTVTISCTDNYSNGKVLYYSLDQTDWTELLVYASHDLSVQVQSCKKVWIKGDNPNGFSRNSGDYYTCISANKSHSIGGNILYLINSQDVTEVTLVQFMFYKLFKDDTYLVDASKLVLPSGNWVFSMCQYMFTGCTSLVTAPDMSAITSGDGMNNLFDGCSALATAPDLSALTSAGDYGMNHMFKDCTSLTNGPDFSNITSVGQFGLFGIFDGCSALTTAYAPTISWNTQNMNGWLNGVAASGTLYADSSIASSIPTNSANGCPTGWTVVNL